MSAQRRLGAPWHRFAGAAALFAGVTTVLASGCSGPSRDSLQEELDAFALPDAYSSSTDRAAPEPQADWGNYVYRQFEVPADAEACADVSAAFRSWAEEPIDVYEDSRGCTFVSDEQEAVARANVDASGDRVLVEMYVIEDQLF